MNVACGLLRHEAPEHTKHAKNPVLRVLGVLPVFVKVDGETSYAR
jgi:hypothetical protein